MDIELEPLDRRWGLGILGFLGFLSAGNSEKRNVNGHSIRSLVVERKKTKTWIPVGKFEKEASTTSIQTCIRKVISYQGLLHGLQNENVEGLLKRRKKC